MLTVQRIGSPTTAGRTISCSPCEDEPSGGPEGSDRRRRTVASRSEQIQQPPPDQAEPKCLTTERYDGKHNDTKRHLCFEIRVGRGSSRSHHFHISCRLHVGHCQR